MSLLGGGVVMRVSDYRLSITVLFILILLVSQPGFAGQTQQQKPLTDEQKLEQVRRHFESEYQEEDYFRTDRLLLTATGSLKPVHLAPSVANVITAEDIEKMGAITLQEVLKTVPGFHISAYYITGSPIYSIRGVHTSLSTQVLLQVNGLPIKYTYGGRIPYLMHLPVSVISRIEVIRGPGSAVHGADAFAGIINVITKDSHEIAGTKSGLRYGSFDTVDAWLMHGAGYGGWDVMAALDFHKTDGDTDRLINSDLQTLLDALLNGPFGQPPASLTPGRVQSETKDLHLHLAAAKDKWTMGIWAAFKNNAGMGVGLTPVLDTSGTHNMDLVLADINYQNDSLLPDGGLNVRFSYLYMKLDTIGRAFPPGAILPIDDSDIIDRDGNIEFPPDGDSKYVMFTDGV
ncbi:MAG: TonB-dependent receptor plug domain-containing protein, partial [Deltaproteobacteria bacterium]|nr:TonB-dependent receptor plug domain-containing protein [Deltaproteobacteria bacterium]